MMQKIELERPSLSIIVPMYNEREVLETFFARLLQVLDGIGESFEVLCVDDGSTDGSGDMVRQMHEDDARIRLIEFSRNFGKEAALTAGLDYATGQAVIPVDADLQDPPELIADFVAKWREGFEVVYGQRVSRKEDTFLKRVTAGWFYSVMHRLAGIDMPANAGDFRLLDRRVVDALIRLREHNRFMKGLFSWVGFRQCAIPYERPARAAGQTKFNYWKLWNFALDGVTGFSTLPLKMAGYFGFLTSVGSIAYGGFLLVRTLVYGIEVPGYASTMVAVLLLGGLQLMVLGIIGEYLGRTYTEAKQRPLYVIREAVGLDEPERLPIRLRRVGEKVVD